MARHMAERSYFKRFNTGTYITGLLLDTEEGIDIHARQIDNILTVDDDE